MTKELYLTRRWPGLHEPSLTTSYCGGVIPYGVRRQQPVLAFPIAGEDVATGMQLPGGMGEAHIPHEVFEPRLRTRVLFKRSKWNELDGRAADDVSNTPGVIRRGTLLNASGGHGRNVCSPRTARDAPLPIWTGQRTSSDPIPAHACCYL